MRLKRIDVFRLIAIYLVVWAHCQFFDDIKPESLAGKGLELGVVTLMRSTMPFFFIASGYFLGGKIIENQPRKFVAAWNYTKKLLLVFLFWCLVYALENPEAILRLAEKHPLTLLFEGTRLHLWFLVSLMLTVWLFTIWPLDKKGYSFLVFGSIVFGVGLLGGSYAVTPAGLSLDFNTRNGIFFSAIFFAIGALLRAKRPQIHPAFAWGLYLSGLAIFALETWFLRVNWSALPIRHDYLLGSVPYGMGMFLVAYSARRETTLDDVLAPHNKYVLGIYVSHMLFLDILKPLGNFMDPILWGFLFPILVFGSSLAAVILLSKTPLRRFVI